MSEPGVVPPKFASEATFDATSGLPAGAEALEGTATRVSPPTSFWEFGLIPGRSLKAQWLGYFWGLVSDWVIWVSEAVATVARTAHLVKTDSNGKTGLQYLTVGDGSGGALNSDTAIRVYGDGTKTAIEITNQATALEALRITSTSTAANALKITQSGAGRSGLEVIGNSTTTAAVFTGGGGIALTGSSTSANAIEGTGGSGTAGVKGVGGVGVRGDASIVGGTGVYGTCFAGATSAAEGVMAIGLADGVGLRASAVDGNAIVASATGEEDLIVCQSGGDGAAVRMDPRATAPAVDRAGQTWALDVDTDIAQPMFCGNATGLSATPQRYFWGGTEPLVSNMAEDDSTQTFGQGVTNQTVLDVLMVNLYAVPVDVRVSARATIENDSGAGTPIESFSLHLFDATASTTMETDSFSLLTETHRVSATIEERYTLPAATSTTIRLRISVGAGAPLDEVHLSHAKLSVMTIGAGSFVH